MAYTIHCPHCDGLIGLRRDGKKMAVDPIEPEPEEEGVEDEDDFINSLIESGGSEDDESAEDDKAH